MAMDATTRLGPDGRRICAPASCPMSAVASGCRLRLSEWRNRGSVRSEVTLTGWIFMVGLRVFDIGALVVWLVWFFKLRDDEDDEGGGGAPAALAARDPTAALPSPTPAPGRGAGGPSRRPLPEFVD